MKRVLNKIAIYFRTYYFTAVVITLSLVAVLIFMRVSGIHQIKEETPVKRIYFADNISASHRMLIKRFNKIHQGKIEVVPIDLPFEKFSTNERKELLIRSLRGVNDRIDIFSVDQIWVPRFAKWSEPLNKFIGDQEKSQIIDQVLETCYLRDTLVAVPLYLDIGLMYCNDAILKQSPKYLEIRKELENSITWEKFIKYGREFERTGIPFYLFPADNYEGLMCSFVEMVKSQNDDLFMGDTVRLNSNAAHRSLQLLVDFVNGGDPASREMLNFRETEAYFQFVKNGGIFLRGWSGLNNWYRWNVKNENESKIFNKYPLPHFENGKPVSVMGGWNLMISKYSTKKAEAVEFIKYIISEDAQRHLYEEGGYLPIRKSFYADSVYVRSNSELVFYNKLLKTIVHRPFLEKYTRFSDIISFYLNKAIRKELGVKEALAKAERIINSGDIFIK